MDSGAVRNGAIMLAIAYAVFLSIPVVEDLIEI
jgi:hypothetical protein